MQRVKILLAHIESGIEPDERRSILPLDQSIAADLLVELLIDARQNFRIIQHIEHEKGHGAGCGFLACHVEVEYYGPQIVDAEVSKCRLVVVIIIILTQSWCSRLDASAFLRDICARNLQQSLFYEASD